MNIELNTPKNLSIRQTYINELTSIPYWTKPRLMEEVSGWRAGPILLKKLLQEETGELVRNIAQNRVRINEWKQQLIKCKIAEEQAKLSKMISRWSNYNQALLELKEKVTETLRSEKEHRL